MRRSISNFQFPISNFQERREKNKREQNRNCRDEPAFAVRVAAEIAGASREINAQRAKAERDPRAFDSQKICARERDAQCADEGKDEQWIVCEQSFAAEIGRAHV